MKTDPFPAPDKYDGIHLFNTSGTTLPVDVDEARRIAACIERHDHCSFQLVEVAFVNAEEITEINREHLEHDYVTDIITFGYREAPDKQQIEGTLYCCAPQIMEQAGDYDRPPEEEFRRIIIHGMLHLIGYDDRSDADQKQMSEREDFYLQQLS